MVVAAGIATLYLDAAAAGFEVGGGLVFGGLADLDAVIDDDGAGGFAHSGGYAFVLDDIGFAIDVGDAALDADGEFVLVDFGLSEFGADERFQLGIGQLWLLFRSGGGGAVGGGLGSGVDSDSGKGEHHRIESKGSHKLYSCPESGILSEFCAKVRGS